jgi:CRISPR type IV-associated DEAD/DEAH-box helicase Csf4
LKSIAVSVAVPEALTGASEPELRAAVRRAFELATASGVAVELKAPPPPSRRLVHTYLKDAELAYLKALREAQSDSGPLAAAAARIAEAGLRLIEPVSAPAPAGPDYLAEVLAALGLPRAGRTEQRGLYAAVARALGSSGINERAIVPAQASTGVGKTIVAIAIALLWLARSPQCRIVIASPTLQGMRSALDHWRRAAAGLASAPRVTAVAGRSEFVSARAVDEFLADAPAEAFSEADIQAIAAWRAAQNTSGEWAMESLLNVCSRVDRQALMLDADTADDDPGKLAWQQQFADARGGQVVLCTHAMLATDILMRIRPLRRHEEYREARSALRRQYFSEAAQDARDATRASGLAVFSLNEEIAELTAATEASMGSEEFRRLPRYDYLIVDEAHQLEQAFSNAWTATVSLRVLLATLRALAGEPWPGGGASLKRAFATLDGALAQIAALIGDEVDLTARSDLASQARLQLGLVLDALQDIRPARAEAEVAPHARRLFARVARDRDTLRLALAQSAGQRLLTFTPVRRFPHLTVGSGDVREPMNMLWHEARQAVLLSATLYMRRAEGWSSRYQCSLLDVPAHRVVEVPVVESAWLVAPVAQLFMPARLDRPAHEGYWLRPPTRSDGLTPADAESLFAGWVDEVAEAIAQFAATAAGGLLVPCPSRVLVQALDQRLRATLEGGGYAVLASTRAPSLHALRAEALRFAAAGRRVAIFGTGGLWTGFDLSGAAIGVSAEQDNVLTDLVIPRLPFGTNRTLTHKRRVEDPRSTVPHETLAVALLMQQVLGRLVRREGLPRNRRICLLDARLVDPMFDAFFAPIKRTWSLYPAPTFLRPAAPALASS